MSVTTNLSTTLNNTKLSLVYLLLKVGQSLYISQEGLIWLATTRRLNFNIWKANSFETARLRWGEVSLFLHLNFSRSKFKYRCSKFELFYFYVCRVCFVSESRNKPRIFDRLACLCFVFLPGFFFFAMRKGCQQWHY